VPEAPEALRELLADHHAPVAAAGALVVALTVGPAARAIRAQRNPAW